VPEFRRHLTRAAREGGFRRPDTRFQVKNGGLGERLPLPLEQGAIQDGGAEEVGEALEAGFGANGPVGSCQWPVVRETGIGGQHSVGRH
jgi:hypothetical protein